MSRCPVPRDTERIPWDIRELSCKVPGYFFFGEGRIETERRSLERTLP